MCTPPSFGMTPTFFFWNCLFFSSSSFFFFFWKVCVIPKERWTRPCAPVLLLVWQWLRTLGTFLQLRERKWPHLIEHCVRMERGQTSIPLLSINSDRKIKFAQMDIFNLSSSYSMYLPTLDFIVIKVQEGKAISVMWCQCQCISSSSLQSKKF